MDLLPDGDPIILKGGSLTIQFPDNQESLDFNSATKAYEHKEKHKKIAKIVVKDEGGRELFSSDSSRFPNGKPSIEIFMR